MDEHPRQWIRIRSESGPDLKLFRARFDYMRNPRNDQTEKMIVLEASDSVNVVALTAEEEILFVRQYRFGIEDYTVELPGGIVDPGEAPALTAIRELREETGYTAGSWQPLGKVASNPVFMDSWIHHWKAEKVERTHQPQLDDGEEVEVLLIPLPEVKQKMDAGFFKHPHTVTALLYFFNEGKTTP